MRPRVSGMKADGVGTWHKTSSNKRGHKNVKHRVRRSLKRSVRAREEASVAQDEASAVARAQITYPPRAGTGVRHVVFDGEERTLCGADANLWLLEARRFESATIGCRRCKAIWSRASAPSSAKS